MTEQEFADLAAACDRVLRAGGASLERVAVPMLHLINEHPGWLQQYEPLAASAARPRIAPALGRLTDPPRAMLRVARALTRSMRARPEAAPPTGGIIGEPAAATRPRTTEARNGRLDVLIVSHLASPAQLDQEDDFYFGRLQNLLHERGLGSALAFVDHRIGAQSAAPGIGNSVYRRYLLPQVAPLRDEARIWRRCAKARQELQQIAAQAQIPLDRAVASLASRHALSWGTAANLRLHDAIDEICFSLNPRMVITTYEGDASERMIWHAARCSGRRPLCVGYQHTRVLRLAHSVRRSVDAPGVDCDPDVILTLGEISHADLAASESLRGVRLVAFGSHRRPSTTPFAHGERTRSCLVLPDAQLREYTTLSEFAVACALRMPDMAFSLRPHPNADLTAQRTSRQWLRSLPPNVTLSRNRTLEQDCERARYCLYRGSSAATYAVMAGVRPVYVGHPGELPFDPLFALPEWRLTVGSPEEFCVQVRIAEASPQPESARRAADFCGRYVSPVRRAAIDDLLEEAFRRCGNPPELVATPAG